MGRWGCERRAITQEATRITPPPPPRIRPQAPALDPGGAAVPMGGAKQRGAKRCAWHSPRHSLGTGTVPTTNGYVFLWGLLKQGLGRLLM